MTSSQVMSEWKHGWEGVARIFNRRYCARSRGHPFFGGFFLGGGYGWGAILVMTEIREICEGIVFGESVEEKVRVFAGNVSDEDRGKGLGGGVLPGREDGLCFEKGKGKREFKLPGIGQLEKGDEEQRGVLLHFFANHELLATELMALVLLKFPEAPSEFRRGVWETLKEEQRHTRWYLERMKACGVRFGDLPVSGYFWDAVAPMETPLDYVTRLSLTFEQANLDYSKHYAGVFAAVGDVKTARILNRVCRDEIGHVGYGLEWFRKWREGESDWDAYERGLRFPMSPSRAKGNGAVFNREARMAAGLEADFVDRLELFERSKGRTPNVFVFFPDEEAAMASGLAGKGYQAREEVAQLAGDLEVLCAFLARRDDVVLVRRLPSAGHLKRLREAGFELPEFEEMARDGRLAEGGLVGERKVNELRPWSWGPQSARVMGDLVENLPGDAEAVDFWNEWRRVLFSKAWEAGLFGKGIVCDTPERVLGELAALRASGYERAVVKAVFGASGQKNQVVVTDGAEDAAKWRWVERMLAQQGRVVVEGWEEDRVLDFSVQYEMGVEGLRKLGVVRVENDGRGQFVSALWGPKICHGLGVDLARLMMSDVLPAYEVGGELAATLERGLREAGYVGPVGVDGMVYRESRTGELRGRMVVEVNPRYTMGRMAYELGKRVASGRWVRFGLSPVRAGVVGSISRDEAGKMSAGELDLNEGDRVRAVLEVRKRVEEFVG
ncbi:MAG: DUF455 family protein [Verrucomicrobiota bacterium]